MSGLLESIVENKRAEVARMGPAPAHASRAATLDVPAALRTPGRMALIAEIKKRSPSAGDLSTALSPAERALAYARAGARMVSVLCDSRFFGGSWSDLASVRDAVSVPVLAKEFVIEPIQLDWARAHGADAVLLIVRILTPDRLAALVSAARDRGLEPLVEVTSATEVELALRAGARIVGVNARDLDTLVMDRARANAVQGHIPKDVIGVHLSGLKNEDDVAQIARTGVDAALVGEALMRQHDPFVLLAAMVDKALR